MEGFGWRGEMTRIRLWWTLKGDNNDIFLCLELPN